MQPPPPLSEIPRFPITTSVALLAVLATVQSENGADMSRFLCGAGDCLREPWRLLTCTLIHAGYFHLFFNLCWLWLFGTKIETEFGHGRALAIFVLLGAGSMAAELALFHGGVGLSGVGYGLFGLLWVLSRTDRRFYDSVDRRVVELMVGWFFFCILMTVSKTMPVANVAHGVGCLLGVLLGWTISARQRLAKFQRGAVLAGVFLFCMAGGTVARPYVNLSSDYAAQLAYQGYVALERGDSRQAVDLYERAVAKNPNVFEWWNNLGIAYRQTGRLDEAMSAYERSLELKPRDSKR